MRSFLWIKKMAGQVKWFSSGNINSPELSNSWGSLLNVLEACLLTGYGSQAIQSITIENGVATSDFSTAHKLEMFQWVEISGSTIEVLNGEFKVLGATATTIEFLVDLPNQTIAETLSCRLAPLGWSKPFSDTGRAVFQAKNTAKNPYFLRVDDTCDPLHTPTRAKFAKVGILESCTGIDDISGNQAPFDPLLPTKNWIGTGTVGSTSAYIGWARWIYATVGPVNTNRIALTSIAAAEVRDWILVGDDESFYILPGAVGNASTHIFKDNSVCYGFGVFEGLDCPFLVAENFYTTIGDQYYIGDRRTMSSKNHGRLVLLKNRDGSYISGVTQTIYPTLNYGVHTGSTSGATNVFLANELGGIYHAPFVAVDTQNAYLGTMPILRNVLNSTETTEPLTTLFSDMGRAYIKHKHIGTDNVRGSIILDLGEIA